MILTLQIYKKKIDKCKKKSSPDFVIRRKWQTLMAFSF